MKILHVIDSAGIYGAEIMLLALMEEQRKLRHEPVLLSMGASDSSDPDVLYEEAVRRGLCALKFRSKRGYSLGAGLRILRLAKDVGAHVIHTHGYKGNILLGSIPRFVRRVPVISTVHGWTATRKFTRIWFYSLLDRYFLGKLDLVVNVHAASPFQGHPRTRVVLNGIPELVIDGPLIGTDDAISTFTRNGFAIGSISRLSEEKGLVYLIEAISLLAERGLAVKAVIIGEGPQRRELERVIGKHGLCGQVLLAGYRENAYGYIPLLDAFVLPSLTEGLPITVLEAMQTGVPVIASRVGGIPAVLRNGDLGILTEPGNAKAIADAVTFLYANREQGREMGRRARHVALNEYSSRRMAEEYMDVYATVLS